MITGKIIIDSKGESRHEGIILVLEGSITLHFNPKGVGLIETFYNPIKAS